MYRQTLTESEPVLKWPMIALYLFQTHHAEQPDTSRSPSSITRTDGQICQDLDGLNSDLVSARDMTGEATQDLCFHQDYNGGLMVEGQRYQDFAIDRSPLTKEKLMHIMHNK